MEILLVRHGLPVHIKNPDGNPADPPLSEVGREQALLVAEWLKEESIDRIYSSPLRRARETADPLAKRLGLEVEIEERISEFDAESSEYIPLEELKRTNAETASAIHVAWDAAGLLTERNYLREKIRQAKARTSGQTPDSSP